MTSLSAPNNQIDWTWENRGNSKSGIICKWFLGSKVQAPVVMICDQGGVMVITHFTNCNGHCCSIESKWHQLRHMAQFLLTFEIKLVVSVIWSGPRHNVWMCVNVWVLYRARTAESNQRVYLAAPTANSRVGIMAHIQIVSDKKINMSKQSSSNLHYPQFYMLIQSWILWFCLLSSFLQSLLISPQMEYLQIDSPKS